MNVAQENEACIILNPINRQIIPDLLGQRTIEDNERIQVEKNKQHNCTNQKPHCRAVKAIEKSGTKAEKTPTFKTRIRHHHEQRRLDVFLLALD